MQDLAESARRLPAPPRSDIVGAGVAAVLVATAFVVPRIASEQWRAKLYAGTAPIFGDWLPHAGWGTVPAAAVATLVVTWGPALAQRLPWRRLLVTAGSAAVAWAFSLAMVDGWQRGFAGRLTDPNEYLHEVGGVTDIPVMLRAFSGRILDFQPDSWTTHVSGHPPGALLFFVVLDRLGLGGGTWAGLVCMVIGCSAVVAVAVALRALGAEHRARAALPFLVLAPAALWIAVSADAMFAGVTAWAVALLAIACRPGGSPVAGVSAGVLFGFGIYLSYGLVLMAIPAAAVLLSSRTAKPLLLAAAGALAVAAGFTLAGFWWLDGYHLVVERYYQGIAAERSYAYWWWGNLAATVCAVGLATCAAARRALAWTRLRALEPASLLVGAGLCAVLAADISGLSKAETERIWLPFDMWLLVATAFLPRFTARAWLGVQALGTLLVAHLILTNW
ncbi:hypothetical protein IU459_18295 [Nocardia amamiensis]|uniref:Integral membrane protein n=1 Tax=Nocardia amamiensis TaxID=404578 RepID=A0ABS0CUF8_9NOCA|nr:hypothetical protein [Nocardia amamiensis]MBF6299478.1 hypothetical protein [Nocardia amamiensis]